jgi:hypothetical protein
LTSSPPACGESDAENTHRVSGTRSKSSTQPAVLFFVSDHLRALPNLQFGQTSDAKSGKWATMSRRNNRDWDFLYEWAEIEIGDWQRAAACGVVALVVALVVAVVVVVVAAAVVVAVLVLVVEQPVGVDVVVGKAAPFSMQFRASKVVVVVEGFAVVFAKGFRIDVAVHVVPNPAQICSCHSGS